MGEEITEEQQMVFTTPIQSHLSESSEQSKINSLQNHESSVTVTQQDSSRFFLCDKNQNPQNAL